MKLHMKHCLITQDLAGLKTFGNQHDAAASNLVTMDMYGPVFFNDLSSLIDLRLHIQNSLGIRQRSRNFF